MSKTTTDGRFEVSIRGVPNRTGQLYVPAAAERNEELRIDDTVEVTIHGVGQYIDTVSFESTFGSGSRVTVPVDVVREVGLELPASYDVEFERVEEDAEAESETTEEADEPDSLGELFETDDGSETTEDESEEQEGLGALFG